MMIERLPGQPDLFRSLLDRGAPETVAAEYAHRGIENSVLRLCLPLHFYEFDIKGRNVKSRSMVGGRSGRTGEGAKALRRRSVFTPHILHDAAPGTFWEQRPAYLPSS